MRKIFSPGLIIIFLVVFFSVTNVRAGILSPELERALQSAGPTDEIPAIVRLAEKADIEIKDRNKGIRRSKLIKALKNKADLTQWPLKDFLEKRNAKRIRQLWIINGVAVTVTPLLINELRSLPDIGSIGLDGTISIPEVIYAEQTPAEWNIKAVHAPELWISGFTGQGIVVANMDTGVDVFHPDLNGRWRGGTNSWFNPYAAACTPPAVCSSCDASADIPCDISGHGTGTMGIMVGGNAGGSAIGVAPDAQWIAVKIFDDSGRATYSSIHQGFQWLLDPDENPDTDDATDVLNISWGFDENPNECITEFQTDTEVLRAADIAVAYSAGNRGSLESTSVSPANYPWSFAAGATTENNIIAPFSSRGPSACDGSVFPEVVVPGVNIKTSAVSNGGLPNYAYVIGTSFSAPHVAGTMALLLSALPEATVDELEWALKNSAVDLGSEGADNFYGHGLIDAFGAYSLLCPVSFEDVPTGYWAERYIKSLYCNRITTGCSVEPLMFCPEGSVLRAQGAAFIIRSLFGEDFIFDSAPHFADVGETHWAFKYVQKMFEEGISTGYEDGTYKPALQVTRAQSAVLIIRALFGEDFPYNVIPHFTDVPDTHWAFKYIQKMFEEGIIVGYQDGTYRPEAITKRDEMSAVLARAFLGI